MKTNTKRFKPSFFKPLWLFTACGFMLSALPAQVDKPIVLIYQQMAPPVKENNEERDINVPASTAFAAQLRSLDKLEAVLYSPEHPTVERIAREKKWKPEQLSAPTSAMLQQIAREWGARYWMVVLALQEDPKQPIAYQVELWQVGKRDVIWSERGTQQLVQTSSNLGSSAALQSMARTLTLKMNAAALQDLPVIKSPEVTTTTTDNPPPVSALNPKKEALELLKRGDYESALPYLRLAVNESPKEADWRLRLIDAYRKLKMNAHAQSECERAITLFPQREDFFIALVNLYQAENRLPEARAALNERLLKNPQAFPLLLALFDLEMTMADREAASLTYQRAANLSPESPETRWRFYLLMGAKGDYEPAVQHPLDSLPTLTLERYSAAFQISAARLSELSAQIMDLKTALADPNPTLSKVKPRIERLNQETLAFGRWLDYLKPEPPVKRIHDQLKFANSLLTQSAQRMARYLLNRQQDDLDAAILNRNEALRELESARKAFTE